MIYLLKVRFATFLRRRGQVFTRLLQTLVVFHLHSFIYTRCPNFDLTFQESNFLNDSHHQPTDISEDFQTAHLTTKAIFNGSQQV